MKVLETCSAMDNHHRKIRQNIYTDKQNTNTCYMYTDGMSSNVHAHAPNPCDTAVRLLYALK
jgi:hypothetical protein